MDESFFAQGEAQIKQKVQEKNVRVIPPEYDNDIGLFNYHSGWINGLAMASMPSAGQMSTTAVPRHTTRPSCRVSSETLKESSESARG